MPSDAWKPSRSLKFPVVIPQKIRESLGLRSGEKVKMVCFRNLIEIIPVREIRSLRGFLHSACGGEGGARGGPSGERTGGAGS